MIGVVSRTNECGNQNFPTIYSRVTERRNWILRNTNSTQNSNCDSEPETTTITPTTESDTDTPLPRSDNDSEGGSVPAVLIAGVSTGGLLLIVAICAAVWCWRSGHCAPACSRNTEVVEQNEAYGAPKDYYEYDKDAYDTRVVDNNEDYYEEEE